MAGAGDNHFLFQVRSSRANPIVCARVHLADHVMLTGGEYGGLTQLSAVEERRELPVAIEIAIPVNASAKAGALELRGKEIQVGFRQPGRQLVRHRTRLDKLFRLGEHESELTAARRIAG